MKCILQSFAYSIFSGWILSCLGKEFRFLIVSMLAFLPCLHAQSPAYCRYNTSSGLACHEVYDVLQDRSGFIWTATDRGIFRYDGYMFQSFTTAQGLTDNTVFLIEEDFSGRIWAMPFNGELCYIENDKVVAYEFNDTLKKYLSGMHIARSLYVLPSGGIQVGFLMHGMVEISAEGKFSRIAVDTVNVKQYYTAYAGPENQLLVASGYGSSVQNGNSQFTFRSSSLQAKIVFGDIVLKHHIAGIRRRSGKWCFAMGNELLEIDIAGKTYRTPLPSQPLCLFEDADDCLWVGLSGGGVRCYAAGTDVTGGMYETFYPGETITCVEQDSEGGMWIGTHDNGLLYAPFRQIRSWELLSEKEDEVVDLIPGKGGEIYCLWRDHGAAFISNSMLTIYPVPLPYGKSFRSMVMDPRSDELIISSAQSTYVFNTQTRKGSVFSIHSSNSVLYTEEGIYLGLSWSLKLIRPDGTGNIIGDKNIRHRPDVLFADSKKQVWMGALDGVYLVSDTTLISYSAMHPLLGKRITAICELPDSTLVVATQSNGIAFLRNGSVRTLTQADHFPCDHIVAVTPGPGNSLWVSAKDGLFHVVANESGFTVNDYPELKTIVGNGGACFFARDKGTLWIANENRIMSFDPSHITPSQKSPPVYIRKVIAGDSVLPVAENIRLIHTQNSLRILFTGLAYRLHGNIAYRYRLAEEEPWKYTSQNTVEFASLEPGEYFFEVQAQNESGVWSERPATFSFLIYPPFWQTWWFRTLALLAVACAGYSIVLIRFRIRRRRDLLREQALVFRQQALASQMNPHFVFNALNTIQSLVLRDEKTKALDMFSSFASLLRKSLEHAGERYIPLAEEIKTLHLYFELETMRFEERLQYTIHVDETISTESFAVPAMLVQPLVENAILHGIRNRPAGGHITVRFLMVNNNLVCEVEDNGIGRKAASDLHKGERKHAGMKITEDRLRVLSQMTKSAYAFEIADKYEPLTANASGTLVRFIIPHVYQNQNPYGKTTGPSR